MKLIRLSAVSFFLRNRGFDGSWIEGTFSKAPHTMEVSGFAHAVELARVAKIAATLKLGGVGMKFYTIKLPKFLGSFVKAVLNTFSKS